MAKNDIVDSLLKSGEVRPVANQTAKRSTAAPVPRLPEGTSVNDVGGYFDAILAPRGPRTVGPPWKTKQQKMAEGEQKHQDRVKEQEEAADNTKNSFLKYLGVVAKGMSGQQVGIQESADAVTGLQEARKAEKKLLEPEDWAGRDEAVGEFKTARSNLADSALSFLSGNPISGVLRGYAAIKGMDTAREKLDEGDIIAGNGERSVDLLDRAYNTATGTGKNIGSGLLEGITDLAEWNAASVASQNPGAPVGMGAVEQYEKAGTFDDMYAAASSLHDNSAADLARAKNGLDAIGRAGVDIGQNVMEMAFDAGVAAATGSGALVPMFARVAGGSMLEAREEGVSLDKRLLYGTVKGLIEVGTEKLFDGVAKVYGKGAVSDEVIESLVNRLASTETGRKALRVLAGATGESLEEFFSGVLEPAAEWVKSGELTPVQWEEVAYSMAIAFTIGGLGSVTSEVSGQNRQAEAQTQALNEVYSQLGERPNFRQEVRDRSIMQNLQQNPNFYRNQTVEENAEDAMRALGGKTADATRAAQLAQAAQAAVEAQARASEEAHGVTRDASGEFVVRAGQNINMPKTAKQLTVFQLLTQTDIGKTEAALIAGDPGYRQAFTDLTGVELSGKTAPDIATIQKTFQNDAGETIAEGATETSPDSSEAPEAPSDELNSASEAEVESETAEPAPKPQRIGPKRGARIAREAADEAAIRRAEAEEAFGERADIVNDSFDEDFEAADARLQQDAAETARRAEEAEAKRAADASRPGPIGPKRAAQMDREANAEADRARAEAREEESDLADIEGDFDEDAAAEEVIAAQEETARAAEEAERRESYEERRKAGLLTEEEKAEAKSAAEVKRTEETNKRLPKLAEWAKNWANRWQSKHSRHDDASGTVQFFNLADAIQGYADGTTTARELYDAYEALNGEEASADAKLFYEPDVAANLENLAKLDEGLDTAEDRAEALAKLERQNAQAMANLQCKLERVDRLTTDTRGTLTSETMMVSRASGHGLKQMWSRAKNLFTAVQSRVDTMFKFYGGFDALHSKEWYGLSKRTANAEKNFINIGYNARNYFYLIQSQSKEMARAWSQLESGKLKGNVELPVTGKMSLNYELSLLRTLETPGGISHIAGNGYEMAWEKDFYAGLNNNGWGDKPADHNVISKADINELAIPYLEAVDPEHPTAEEWRAAEIRALTALKDEIKADVMSSDIGKAVYEASQEVVKYLAREVNKVCVRMFGYEKALNKDYYPLNDASSGANIKADETRAYDMDAPDFLKGRDQNAKNALRIEPFTVTMLNYIQEASNWAAFAEIWSDIHIMDKTMDDSKNNPTISGMVNQAYGKYAADYLGKWLNTISNNRAKSSFFNKALGKIRKNIATASLTLNPGVALKQTPSYFAAAGILDMDVLIKSRLMTGGIFRTAKSYSNNPVIRQIDSRTNVRTSRMAGYNTIELGEALENTRSISGKIVNKILNKAPWITGRDVSTISNLAIACAEQVKKDIANGKYGDLKVESDEYYNVVAHLLEEVVTLSQPIYDPQFRAEFLRSDNEVMRSAAMFKTQPSQDFNQLYTALAENGVNKSNVKQAKADLERAKSRLEKLKADHASEAKIAEAQKNVERAEAELKEAQSLSRESGRRVKNMAVGQFIAKAAFSGLTILADLLTHRTKKYKDEEGNWSAEKFLTRFLLGTASSAASILWFGDTLVALGADIITGVSPLDDTSEFYSISEATIELVNNAAVSLVSFAQTIGDPDKTGWQKAKAAKELAVKTASMFGIPLQNAYNLLNTVVMYELDNDKTKNFDHNDDFMRSMSNYSQLSDTSIASKTMARAAQSYSEGKLSEAEMLLATLNFDSNSVISAVASQAKEDFINGTLTESQFRKILSSYCKKSWKEVNAAVDDANRDIAYNKAKAENKAAYETVEALLDATTDKYRSDDRPRDYYVMDAIVSSALGDKDKDIFVDANLTKAYRNNYNTLRHAGMSSSKAAEFLEAVDSDKSGGLDQEEMYKWYLGHKADEKRIAALWNAQGYKTSWDKFKESRKNMAYDEVLLEHENDAAFKRLDAYAKDLQQDAQYMLQNAKSDRAILGKISEMGLSDTDFDAAVKQYVSSGGKKAYYAARNEGVSPKDAVALMEEIDSYYQPKKPKEQSNGSFSIAELIAYYKEHPDQEDVIKAIYYATTTSDNSWEYQKKKAKVK